MTKNDIKNFVIKTLMESGGALSLAQSITGKNKIYSDRQICAIILDYLEANNYDDDIICQIVEVHRDKPFFDVYYDCMQERERENKAISKAKLQAMGNKCKKSKSASNGKKMNCCGILVESPVKPFTAPYKLYANGTTENATDKKQYLYPKIAMGVAVVGLVGIIGYCIATE